MTDLNVQLISAEPKNTRVRIPYSLEREQFYARCWCGPSHIDCLDMTGSKTTVWFQIDKPLGTADWDYIFVGPQWGIAPNPPALLHDYVVGLRPHGLLVMVQYFRSVDPQEAIKLLLHEGLRLHDFRWLNYEFSYGLVAEKVQ